MGIDEIEQEKEGEATKVEPKSEDASPLNILIVDDTEEAVRAVEGLVKSATQGNCNVQVTKSPDEAITIIYKSVKESRSRIHLVISDVHMPEETNGISFLRSIRARIAPAPFTVVMSGYPDSGKLRGISDKFLSKPEDITLEKFKELLDECTKYWESIKAESVDPAVSATASPAENAQRAGGRLPSIPPPPKGDEENNEVTSPFPPLKKFDTHNPLKIPDESLPLALFDLDGTLTRDSTADVILLAGFVRRLWETQDKSLWEPLKDRFDDWMGVNLGEMTIEDFYRKWKPEHDKQEADVYGFYEDQIEMTSKIFGRCLRGMEVEETERIAKDWVTEQMSSEKSIFYDYVKPIIEHTSKMGIYSTIITGAPDFLVKPIADHLGIPFYFGMEFETRNRSEGQESESPKELFTGAVRYITGKKDAKKKICDKLDEQNKPRLIGMGNSDADEPIVKATSASILVNPGSKDARLYRQYCFTETQSDRVTIANHESQAIVSIYRNKITNVLRQKKHIRKACDILLNMDSQNTEGEKRKFTLNEAMERLNDFYGYETVYRALQLDIDKIHPDYLAYALERIGVSEESIAEIDEAIRYYQKTGQPWKDEEETDEGQETEEEKVS